MKKTRKKGFTTFLITIDNEVVRKKQTFYFLKIPNDFSTHDQMIIYNHIENLLKNGRSYIEVFATVFFIPGIDLTNYYLQFRSKISSSQEVILNEEVVELQKGDMFVFQFFEKK